MKSEPSNQLVTSMEAADMLGVSIRTVQLWIANGVLEAEKTAEGDFSIARDSLEKLLALQHAPIEQKNQQVHSKILIVEDDAFLLDLYLLKIGSWKLPVELLTVSNGFAALSVIGEQKPDLVIADLSLPGMDGFQMIDSLDERSQLKNMDLVVVTGLSNEEIAKAGTTLPKNITILKKPVSFDLLYLILQKVLKKTARDSGKITTPNANWHKNNLTQ